MALYSGDGGIDCPASLRAADHFGNGTLSGKAQDQLNGPGYRLHWHLYEHWILNGFFPAVDQTWKGNGQVLHALEMLSYDTGKQVYTDSGFGSDGSTWSSTAIFDNSTMTESGATRGSDGEITKCKMPDYLVI